MGSVNTTSAPNARRIRLRSGVTLSGTHKRTRYPRAAPIIAYAMPVLPDVASSRILSRVSAPDRSPSRIIRAAGRSLTEPPGFLPLRLCPQLDVAESLLKARQPNERRIAYQIDDGRGGSWQPKGHN